MNMKLSQKIAVTGIALAALLGNSVVPASASTTTVTASLSTVTVADSTQFTVAGSYGENMAALFKNLGNGWVLEDYGFVKDTPLIPWSMFSPACNTTVTIVYRVYDTLMVDSDPNTPPQYGDSAYAGQSDPVEVVGANCADTTPPVITNGSDNVSIYSGTTAVETYSASKAVAWSVTGGANAALFSIDASGLLSFKAAAVVGTYDVIITATDAKGNATTYTIHVTVTQAPAPAVVPDPPLLITGPNTPTLTPGGTSVGKYTANRQSSWSITGGANASLFEINSNGDLSFKTTPAPGTYTVIITAKDAAGNVTTQTITVTVPAVAPTPSPTPTPKPTPTVAPTQTPTPVAKVGKRSFDVYFGMDAFFLDAKARSTITNAYNQVKAQFSSTSVTTVEVTGWVQPTKNSPNVQWLSSNRAKAVAGFLKSLGLKGKYVIKAPGHDKLNVSTSRRATVVITWSNPK